MKVIIAPENKFCLTLEEASVYFNVGVKRLARLLDSPEGANLTLMVGVKRLVKRQKMEAFLEKAMSV